MLKIVPRGPLKDHFPAGTKRGFVVHSDHIPTALNALNQFMDREAVFADFRWRIYVGPTFKKAVELSESRIRWGRFPDDQMHNVYLVPGLEGHDPATMTAIAVQLAVAAITAGLQALLVGKQQDGTGKRKSVLYSGGLNTSTVGAPMAYLAGLKVFCGSQILEGDIRSLQNAGGSSAYVDPDQPEQGTGGDGAGSGGTGGGGLMPDPAYDWISTGRGIYSSLGRAEDMNGLSGAGGGGAKSIADQNVTYAKMLALLNPGCGRTDGPYGKTIQQKAASILLDKVPLFDIGTGLYLAKGVLWTWRGGYLGQPNVQIVPGIPTPREANDPLTFANTPGVSKPVQTLKADYVVARVRMRLLLTQKDGDQKPEEMKLRFEVKRNSASAWTVARHYQVKLKNSEGFDVDVQLDAPPPTSDPQEGWMFRIVRTIADSNSDKVVREATLVGWSEVINTDLTYDGSNGSPAASLLGLDISAVDDGSGDFPEIAVIWSGRQVRVPINYDPETHLYTGLWNGQWKWAATENPVWLWLDMMTATDGMGLGLADRFFDKFKLYDQARYCDEIVGGQARWTVNKQYSDERGFWEHISEFCKTFRSITYYDGSQYYLAMDRPGMAVQHYVNNDNAEDGVFNWDTTEAETQFNSVEVEYDDPAKLYEKSSVTYRDDDDIALNRANGAGNAGIVPLRIYKEGCTSEKEAYRYAQEVSWCALNETEVVNFKTSLNAADYRPGDRIQIDDWTTNGNPPIGRVVSVIDANNFTIGVPFNFQAGKAYKLYAQVGKTRMVKDLPIKSTTSSLQTITLANHGLSAGHTVGIVDPTGVQPWSGIIRTIEDDGVGAYTVSCQEWREDKFSVFAGLPVAPEITFPTLDRSVGQVSMLRAKTYSYVDAMRGSVRKIELHWEAPEQNGLSYIVKHLAPSDVNWRLIDTTTFTFYELEALEAGQHRFTVEAVNLFGKGLPVATSIVLESEAPTGFYPPVFKDAY